MYICSRCLEETSLHCLELLLQIGTFSRMYKLACTMRRGWKREGPPPPDESQQMRPKEAGFCIDKRLLLFVSVT